MGPASAKRRQDFQAGLEHAENLCSDRGRLGRAPGPNMCKRKQTRRPLRALGAPERYQLQQQRPAEIASSCSSARSVAGNATWTVCMSFSCTLIATSSGTSTPSSSETAALGSDNNLLRKSPSTLALSVSRALSSIAEFNVFSSCSSNEISLHRYHYTISAPLVKSCKKMC